MQSLKSAAPDSSFRVDEGALVADWPGLGTYTSHRNPRFVPYQGADPARVRKLERGAVRAIERRMVGEVSLHASAVELCGHAVAVVAPAGLGKSTHAAALCCFAGAAILADDVAFIGYSGDAVVMELSEVDHWVDARASALVGLPQQPDGGKRPTRAHRPAVAAQVHLALVVVLDRSGVSRARRLRGFELLDPLARSLIHLPAEMEGPVSRRRDVDLIAAICTQASVVAWSPPYAAKDGGLPAFAEMVRSVLEGGSC